MAFKYFTFWRPVSGSEKFFRHVVMANTNFIYLLPGLFIAVFNGSNIKNMTHAFMLHVRDGPIYVVFVNKRTNKVFLVEYTGTPIPEFFYTQEYSFCDVFFKFIDLKRFKPREDRQNGTNTGCKALSIQDVSDDMMKSFVLVYTSFAKKKMPPKAVKKVTFDDESAFQMAPAPETNAWYGVPQGDVDKMHELEKFVLEAEADAAEAKAKAEADAAEAKAKAEAKTAFDAKMADLEARLAELTA